MDFWEYGDEELDDAEDREETTVFDLDKYLRDLGAEEKEEGEERLHEY